MISRCYNINTPRYQAYGGKNVTVCSDWHNFTTFYKEVQELDGWIDEVHHSWCKELDKDSKQGWSGDKVYSKETCIWRDKEENNEDQGHQISVTCVNTGEVFRNLARASKWGGGSYCSIHKCAKGIYNTSGRHPITNERLKWKFKES